MTNLSDLAEQYKQGIANTTRLLLVGATKSGKSDYVCQAVKAGFEILYIDKDNGLDTLLKNLKDDAAALKRVHYFNPIHMVTFLEGLMEKPVYRYNATQRLDFVSNSAKPDDDIVEFVPGRIPHRVIISIDSWSSVSNEVANEAAKKANIDVTDMENSGYGRAVYGGGGMRLNNLLTLIQHAPKHFIVQAHPSVYERKERPPGRVEGVKEKDMIIMDTTQIPLSISAPHGYNLGKYFNQIGWLGLNPANQRELDFDIKKNRISGGSVVGKGNPRMEYSFAKLFGNPKPAVEGERPWMIEYKAEKFREIQAAQHANAPKLVVPSRPIPAKT